MSRTKVLPLVTLVVAIAFLGVGLTSYGFWNPVKGPTSGFFPIIVSVALLILSGVMLLSKEGNQKKVTFPMEDFLIVLSVLFVIIAIYLIGMMPAIFVYLFIWTRFIQKENLKTTLILMLSVGGTLALVFEVWFNKLFPTPLIARLFGA